MVEGLFQPIHLVLILAIILIVFGAGKLPEMGGAVGRGIREFRKEVQDSTGPDGAPYEDARVSMTATATKTAPATFCTSCGDRLPAGAKFCPSCGATAMQTETVEAIPAEVEEATRQESPAL